MLATKLKKRSDTGRKWYARRPAHSRALARSTQAACRRGGRARAVGDLLGHRHGVVRHLLRARLERLLAQPARRVRRRVGRLAHGLHGLLRGLFARVGRAAAQALGLLGRLLGHALARVRGLAHRALGLRAAARASARAAKGRMRAGRLQGIPGR